MKNCDGLSDFLPRYFKTTNYASFVRQLNLYGFRKVKCDNGFAEFKHPLFFEGSEKNLKSIKRQINLKKSPHSSVEDPMSDADKIAREITALKKTIASTQQQQRALQSWVNIRKSELSSTNYSARKNANELMSLVYFFSSNEDPSLFPIVNETTEELGIWSSNELDRNFPAKKFDSLSENLCSKIIEDSKFVETLVKQVDKKWTEAKAKAAARDFVSKSGENSGKSDDPLRMSFLSITPIGTPLNRSREPNLFIAAHRQKMVLEDNNLHCKTMNSCNEDKLKSGFSLNTLLNKKFFSDELVDYATPTGSMTENAKHWPVDVDFDDL